MSEVKRYKVRDDVDGHQIEGLAGVEVVLASAYAALEQERDRLQRDLAAARGRIQKLSEGLALILPMAKGYASTHPVGSNEAYVIAAETILLYEDEDANG